MNDDALEDALIYENTLIDLGLVDYDEPLPAHSFEAQRSRRRWLRSEFISEERMKIRLALMSDDL